MSDAQAERLGGIPEQPLQHLTAGRKNGLAKRPRKRDRSGENFRKRWRTLVKTLRQLHQVYGAEFYISISRYRQDYVCRSRDDYLPLIASDIVRIRDVQLY